MIKTKVIIADDHKIFREGIKALITSLCNCSVIADVSNGVELITAVEENQPDLILLDIDMPIMNGTEACQIIKNKYPKVKIIALSMFSEIEFYQKMIEVGVNGFVLKSSGIDELSLSIAKVIEGSNYFSVDLLLNIINGASGDRKEKQLNETLTIKLTESEKSLLLLLCKGLTNEEIADKQCKSIATIKSYKASLFAKTNCKNSTGLVFYAIKHNLVQLDS